MKSAVFRFFDFCSKIQSTFFIGDVIARKVFLLQNLKVKFCHYFQYLSSNKHRFKHFDNVMQ